MWNARQQTSRNESAISPKASACCARWLKLRRGLDGSQPGVEPRQIDRVIFEIVRHLTVEPQVDAQRRLVDFLIVSGVADCALGLGRVFQIVEHRLPPVTVPEQRVSPSAK